MGLSSALATAMSGLRANQAALSIISSNVANANTPGYVTQNPNQIEVASGGFGSTVQTTGVNRQLDLFVQNQLRTETGGSAYATQISNILGQLQSVYGTPGGNGTLETALNNFTTSLQSLSNNPSDSSAQAVALQAAQSLAAELNTTTQGIQSLRTNVDQDIGNSANQANTDLSQIAQINTQLQGLSPTDPQAATLMDQRDSAINDLSKLVDIRVVTDSSNQANIFTTTGSQLVSAGFASQFNFSSAGALTPTSLYNANPAKNGVGTLSLHLPNGANIDVVANNIVSSGQIAADLKLRDQTLVQAQTQVDQFAATLASSLSDQTTAGTAVTGPPAAGFAVNTSNVLPGNTVNLTYTDSSNIQHQVSIVNGPSSALPLQNGPNANPLLVGADFSLGMANVASQLNTALNSAGLQFTGAGSTLNLLGSGSATVNNASAATTQSSLTSVQSAASAIHRRQFALHRPDHGGRLADDRARGAHLREPGDSRRRVETQRLLDVAADRGRRQYALGFPVLAIDLGEVQLFAADRARLCCAAVQRHDHRLPAAIHQPAEQRLDAGDAAAAGSKRRGLDVAAEVQLDRRRQYRHRDVEFDSGSEYLCSQCSHHVGRPKHDAKPAAGSRVRRPTCRSAASTTVHLCSVSPCRTSTRSLPTCRRSSRVA